jgi:hypothetical protein
LNNQAAKLAEVHDIYFWSFHISLSLRVALLAECHGTLPPQ